MRQQKIGERRRKKKQLLLARREMLLKRQLLMRKGKQRGESGDANDDQATRGANYALDKDEAIAMAIVAASEDGIHGMGKKAVVFQAEIFAAFKTKAPVIEHERARVESSVFDGRYIL
jgi:hypothetical protein